MVIHHLNCGSLRGVFPPIEAITYCLLIETDRGLILVDSGLGQQDYLNPSRLMRIFKVWVGLRGDIEETAIHQIEDLGYSPADVRHIVLTHLHLDHAGGLPDFPQAQVHVHRAEYEAAMHPRSWIERAYDKNHWVHEPRWWLHEGPYEDWYGFPSLRIWADGDLEIRLISLPGHTRGHCGVAIRTPSGWLLQCGDAAAPYHAQSDIHGLPPDKHRVSFMPGRFVRYVLGPHGPRLRALLQEHGDEIQAISSHDIYSFRRHAQPKNTP